MKGQQALQIQYSNITKLGFIKCEDCQEQVVCPHYGCRKGCRTATRISEVAGNE